MPRKIAKFRSWSVLVGVWPVHRTLLVPFSFVRSHFRERWPVTNDWYRDYCLIPSRSCKRWPVTNDWSLCNVNIIIIAITTNKSWLWSCELSQLHMPKYFAYCQNNLYFWKATKMTHTDVNHTVTALDNNGKLTYAYNHIHHTYQNSITNIPLYVLYFLFSFPEKCKNRNAYNYKKSSWSLSTIVAIW